jgi:hypothetical protein
MCSFEENAPIKLRKGRRFYLPVAFLLSFGAFAKPAIATERVWGCLLYASTVPGGNQPSDENQARVGERSPLFIRGPDWREGQIIIVVMVGS